MNPFISFVSDQFILPVIFVFTLGVFLIVLFVKQKNH